MEVASPLPFTAGSKRAHLSSCLSSAPTSSPSVHDDHRLNKRRRYNTDISIDSLSNAFSSHSFQQQHKHFTSPTLASLKRAAGRQDGSASPIVQEDLNRVIEEQAAMIESLKKDHTDLKKSETLVKADNERLKKENVLLRRAVNIQQDRHKQSEKDLSAAKAKQAESEDTIKKMEQLVMKLRYHLQTQQHENMANDFMGFPPRPPNVF